MESFLWIDGDAAEEYQQTVGKGAKRLRDWE